MKKLFFLSFTVLVFLAACSRKNTDEGSITYQLEYQLPDSLKQYAEFLPKEAIVYFKGDSTVSIQKTNEESTTIITDRKTNSMRVLLKSPARQFVVDYNKSEQAEEIGQLPPHTINKQNETKTIAGYNATKYLAKDKLSDETTEMWFTKDIALIPNSLTMLLDSTLGTPLAFTISQNGMKTKTTVKKIKFEPVPEGIFTTPAGYVPLTPQQLRQMPVGN
jgi:outer membrane lipoprotein-sorting protein